MYTIALNFSLTYPTEEYANVGSQIGHLPALTCQFPSVSNLSLMAGCTANSSVHLPTNGWESCVVLPEALSK